MGIAASDLFLTSAEIAVAFIGFASLVGIFLSRSGGELSARVRILLWSLVDYGLIALSGCAIPLLLATASDAESLRWDLASGLQLSVTLVCLALSRQSYREALTSLPTETSRGGWILIGGDLLANLALAANVIGWPAEPSLAVYFAAGVVWHLFGSALSFRGVIAMAWSSKD